MREDSTGGIIGAAIIVAAALGIGFLILGQGEDSHEPPARLPYDSGDPEQNPAAPPLNPVENEEL